MKNLLMLLFVCCALGGHAQQDNFDISTLRMGPFKINMSKAEAEAIAGKTLLVPNESNSYQAKNYIVYKEHLMNVELMEMEEGKYQIGTLSTTQPGYKTKSGIGIGSTRKELIQAYQDFSSFSIFPEWDEAADKYSKNNFYFTITDLDASSMILFKLVNNKVVEITVSISMEGC